MAVEVMVMCKRRGWTSRSAERRANMTDVLVGRSSQHSANPLDRCGSCGMDVGGRLRAFRRRKAFGAASHSVWPPAVSLAAIALAMGVSITATYGEGDAPNDRGACAATSLEAAVGRLRDDLGDAVGRFIVTIRSSPAETRGAIEARTGELATALRQAGALMAEPIAGQPLVVVEVRGSQLPQLAEDPGIVCIERDTPEPPAQ
jgi:hypothetical protein